MKQTLTAIRILICLTIITGVFYPLVVFVFANACYKDKASALKVTKGDAIVGVELLGQKFERETYFWSRPSAADFDGAASGASNLSVTSESLQKSIDERRVQGRTRDLLYASGSGLDPHISPDAAMDQVQRIAAARKLTPAQRDLVINLIREYTEDRQWGVFGEPRVHVLKLNIALDNRL